MAPVGTVGSARRRPQRPLRAAIAVVVSAMLTGCGALPSTDSEASSLELAGAFAPCHEGFGVISSDARSEPVGEVEAVHEWVRVVEVMEADRNEDGHAAATVRDESDQVRRLHVWQDTWPAVDWGLEHDAEVWFGMAEPETTIAWVDDDGVLEFWLLDENQELSLDHPLGKLGEVQTGRRSVHVGIDTSGIAADGSFDGHDRVTIVE